MTQVTLPHVNEVGTNSWEDVEGNDRALRDVINGDLDNGNVAANAAIAYSKLAPAATAQALIGNGGTPTMTTLTGDVTVGATGVTAIGNSKVTNAMMADNAVNTAELVDGAVTSAKTNLSTGEDTQSADISANGVLTGISITSASGGTYMAMASARFNPGAIGDDATLSLRVNGVNVVNGPTVKVSGTSDAPTMVVHGILTPTAGQVMEVYCTFTSGGTPGATGGRLTMLRVS